MEECKKGDYFKYNELIVRAVSDWKLDNQRRFNILLVEDITSGAELRVPKPEVRSLVPLSAAEKKRYEKEKDNALENCLKEDVEIIKQVSESLENVFPGNWDIVVGKSINTLYTVIIKFPCFTITNGKGLEHEIHELYTKWTFTKGFTMTGNLEGARGAISYVEYNCGYVHSHLPSSSYQAAEIRPGFNAFCLGTGDFAQANSDWHRTRTFSQEEFELLLYQLDAYVKWESLQGGPYMRISAIGVGNTSSYLADNIRDSQFANVIDTLDHFPLSFDHLNKRFKVIYSSLEDVLSKTNIPGLTKIKKTPKGEYLYGDVTLRTIKNWIKKGNEKFSKDSLLTFRGEDVYLKISAFAGDTENSNLLEVPHPYVTNYIVKKLTEKTNNYFIKTYGK